MIVTHTLPWREKTNTVHIYMLPLQKIGVKDECVPLRILFLSEKMPMFCPRD